MPTLATLREDYARESFELHKIFEEAGADLDMDRVKRVEGSPEEKAAEIKRRNDLLTEISKEIESLEGLGNIGRLNEMRHKQATEPLERPAFNGNGAAPLPDSGGSTLRTKGLRAFLLEHKGYRELRDGRRREIDIEIPVLDFKTLITLSNASPQADRRGLVTMALEERTVGDMMLQGETSSNQVEYYEETTVTNNAATVNEGVAKAESALGWTLRNEPIRKIATWIPATDEVLADVPFMESQIRGRLSYMVQRVEERQLLNGNGVAPNILGILQRPGIQTQAKGTDPTPDAIYKAMQKVRGASGAGFAEPTDVVLHPNDWTDIRLLRTTDGIYIWGNPSDAGPERIWGKPVRQTTEITEGTGLTGAFRPFAEVLRRAGITVTMSTEHSTYFTENKVAILAEERLGLAVYRASAFSTVTGI
jgi:HK97 family phage major capsid protein